jgi:hypothetical protein
MSTSRAKQIAQKRKSKTKSTGNGSRTTASKKKKMKQGAKFLRSNKKRR